MVRSGNAYINILADLDELQPQVLREPADVIVRPLFIIFHWLLQLREVSKVWSKTDVTPKFKKGKKKDLRNKRLVRINLSLGNVILETIFKHMKKKNMISNSELPGSEGGDQQNKSDFISVNPYWLLPVITSSFI